MMLGSRQQAERAAAGMALEQCSAPSHAIDLWVSRRRKWPMPLFSGVCRAWMVILFHLLYPCVVLFDRRNDPVVVSAHLHRKSASHDFRTAKPPQNFPAHGRC